MVADAAGFDKQEVYSGETLAAAEVVRTVPETEDFGKSLHAQVGPAALHTPTRWKASRRCFVNRGA